MGLSRFGRGGLEVGRDQVLGMLSTTSRLMLIPFLLLVFFSGSPGQAESLLINGDFESPKMEGWDYTGSVHDVTYNAYRQMGFTGSEEILGDGSVAFNAGDAPPNGLLSQKFATRPGEAYTVEFLYGAFSTEDIEHSQSITASVKDEETGKILGALVAETTARQHDEADKVHGGAAPYQFTFVAEGSLSRIMFRDSDSSQTLNADGLLDNVRVTESSEMDPNHAVKDTSLPSGPAKPNADLDSKPFLSSRGGQLAILLVGISIGVALTTLFRRN